MKYSKQKIVHDIGRENKPYKEKLNNILFVALRGWRFVRFYTNNKKGCFSSCDLSWGEGQKVTKNLVLF